MLSPKGFHVFYGANYNREPYQVVGIIDEFIYENLMWDPFHITYQLIQG